MTFENQNYQVIRDAVSPDLLKHIQLSCDIHEKINLYNNPPTPQVPFPFSDLSKNCFSWYSPIHGEALLSLLLPTISKTVNKNLIECYSYLRIYYNGGILDKHVDRPSCQYSATVCIKKGNVDWPIFFESQDKKQIDVELNSGDLVVYRGDILNHWRDPYRGDRHVQLFLHYVDLDGPYKENVYDGRQLLALKTRTKKIISKY